MEERKETWASYLRIVLYSFLIAFTIRTFLYEPFYIPTSSLVPTVLPGDFAFASKTSYGYSRYSFPFSLNLFSGRIFANSPKLGDVVVFRLPAHKGINYMKRVVGLPGDRVQMKKGILHINGVACSLKRLNNFYFKDPRTSYQRGPRPQYLETLPNGREHLILKAKPFGKAVHDNTKEFLVPPGHLFMLGDNRDHSEDSRASVGFIKEEFLVGKVKLVFFSTSSKLRDIFGVLKNIRWERVIKGIR